VGESRTARRESWVGDRWTTWIEKAVLLCRREIDDGWLAGWERAGLLGGRAGWERGGRLGGR